MEIHRMPLTRQKPLLKTQPAVPQPVSAPVRDCFVPSLRFQGKVTSYTEETLENDPVCKLNRALWDRNMEAFQNNLDEIRADPEINLNAYGLDGHLPMRVAVSTQNIPAMRALYDAGARPNHTDWQGETPLVRGVTTQNVEVVKELLAMGADVNQSTVANEALNLVKEAPIHIAARLPDPTILNLLIEAKADVDAPDEFLQTALHYAADRANPKAAKALLKAKADSTRVNVCKQTPLDLALDNYNSPAYRQDKKRQLKTIALLLKHGKALEKRTSSTGEPVAPDPDILGDSKGVLSTLLAYARKLQKQATQLIQFIPPQLGIDQL